MAPVAACAQNEAFTAPVTAADGAVVPLQAMLCRPPNPGPAPARLVVIAHGSPPHASDRPTMTLMSCSAEPVRWFTSRGYAAVVFLRRGYGATAGPWAENYGRCNQADYVHAGLETARDMAAVVEATTRMPGIRPDGAIVVGHSAGGWGSLAYDSQPHPKVAAFVSMAGGRGGHHNDQPNDVCRSELLIQSAATFGATATTPMLWIYAANDSFFDPAIATALHNAFASRGGQAELHQVDAFGQDGHRLFPGRGGPDVWGPIMAAYLDRMHVPPR